MPTKTDGRFLMLSIGLAIFALALLWTIAFVITAAPRGSLFWITMDFLSFVVVVTCLLRLNATQRAKTLYRPSGATLAIVGAILTLDIVVTLLSIIVYALQKGHTAHGELYLAGWVAGVNGFAFIIAAFLYGFDISQRVHEAPALNTRTAYQGQGRRLASSIDSLARLANARVAFRGKIDHVIRELRTIQSSLDHSSGGGVGTWEGASGTPVLSPADIENAVSRVTEAIDEFTAGAEPLWPEEMSAVERAVASLQAKVELLNVA